MSAAMGLERDQVIQIGRLSGIEKFAGMLGLGLGLALRPVNGGLGLGSSGLGLGLGT